MMNIKIPKGGNVVRLELPDGRYVTVITDGFVGADPHSMHITMHDNSDARIHVEMEPNDSENYNNRFYSDTIKIKLD